MDNTDKMPVGAKEHEANINLITSVEFTDYWGPRRLKHGGMLFCFRYRDCSWTKASAIVDSFFAQWDYVRGEHYNINPNNLFSRGTWSPVRQPFLVNFANDETFVMAKMELQDESKTIKF